MTPRGCSWVRMADGWSGSAWASWRRRVRSGDVLERDPDGPGARWVGVVNVVPAVHVLPRPGGEGKALRLALPPDPDLPIHLATLSPAGLRLTGDRLYNFSGLSFIKRKFYGEQVPVFAAHRAKLPALDLFGFLRLSAII